MTLDSGISSRRRLRAAAITLCVLSCMLIMVACKDREADLANKSDPQWVAQQTPRSQIAVVFVHGIFGDTLGTWTNATKKTFFGFLEQAPDVGPKVDMFAFGFASNMVMSGSLDIHEAANKLHESLTYNRVLEYPAIVYVAHSMGGLVVLQNLLTRREQLDKVRLIVLFATPQEGSEITTIAKEIANNLALEQMLPADRNGFLRQMSDQWRSLTTRPPIVCGYEKKATKGVMIVPWSSATRFCDGAPLAIEEADHITIVKPDRSNHDSVVLVVNSLIRHVMGQQLLAKLETPDFVPEKDYLVFKLLDCCGRNPARLANSGGTKLSFTLSQFSDANLYVWPDTPREIPARHTERLQIALGMGTIKNEYSFVLKSDVTPDQQVVVRVLDVAVLRAQRAEFVGAVTGEVNAYLGSPGRLGALAKLPVGDKTASNEIVRAVHKSVSDFSPGLPDSAKWVLSAEYLAATNWPDLAAAALRTAEGLSSNTVQSAGVQRLAGFVATQSGKQQVFATVPIANVPAFQPATADMAKLIYESGQTQKSEALASKLKAVPSLKVYGLSLEGDIWQAKGNNGAALASYRASQEIVKSPSIGGRVSTLEKIGPQKPGSVMLKPESRTKPAETLLHKRDVRRESEIRNVAPGAGQK